MDDVLPRSRSTCSSVTFLISGFLGGLALLMTVSGIATE